MAEDQKNSGKRTGRPPKNPELGKRVNVMFRLNEATRDQLRTDAEAAGRSMSEEIEDRLQKSIESPKIYEAVTAVESAANHLASLERAYLETIFSTLEEFEKYMGGKDACSFAAHIGQSVALHLARDAKDAPGSGPWWEDDARREAVRAKVVKSAAGLVDNWDFVQKSSPIPSVGWIIDKNIKANMASSEYGRRHERASLEADAAPKKD